MKHITIDRISTLIRWGCIWVIVAVLLSSQMSLFSLHVAAEDPTPIPTATSAPTWTPVPGSTATPTATVPGGATPGSSPTPTGRLVNFRADSTEIEEGECVLFSWVVKGDVAWVEFDELGDGKEPVLVEDQGEREECPEKDTDYELRVTWLDSSETSAGVEIEVKAAGGNGSGGTGDGTVPPPGTFVPVTPIPLATVLPTLIADNSGSGSSSSPPGGILASITELPETGMWPSASTRSDPRLKGVELMINVAARQPWLAFTGGMVIGLSGILVGLVLLVRLLRHSP